MSNLAITGTMSYGNNANGVGGYTFPVESRTIVAVRAVQDKAGRATKFVEYTFDVTAYILVSPSDGTIATIRQVLDQDGNTFQFTNKGFTDITVGPNGPQYDCNYGPKARVKSLTPLGIANAWRLQWECVVCLPDIAGASKGLPNGVLELTYSIDYAKDDKGYVSRTISGDLEIAAHMTAAELASDCPDVGLTDYWIRLLALFPLPSKSVRRHSRNLSADHKTLHFTINDVQKPDRAFLSPFVDWECNVDVATSGAAFKKWTVTIAASYELPPSGDDATDGQTDYKQLAVGHFVTLIGSKTVNNLYWKTRGAVAKVAAAKLAAAQKYTSQAARKAIANAIGPMVPIPTAARFSEQPHTNRISLSVSYWFIVSDSAAALLASGMFIPIPGAGWKTWKDNADIKQTALSSRGSLNLFYDGKNDAIIDISQPDPFKKIGQIHP